MSSIGVTIEPPVLPRLVVEKGDDNLQIVIDAPLRDVYQTLVNVDKRPSGSTASIHDAALELGKSMRLIRGRGPSDGADP